jgi:hypothetical protein
MGVNFHPHLYGLVTKGGFDTYGVFHPLPWLCCEFSDPLANKGILEFAHPKCLFVLTNKNIYENYTDFQKQLST